MLLSRSWSPSESKAVETIDSVLQPPIPYVDLKHYFQLGESLNDCSQRAAYEVY